MAYVVTAADRAAFKRCRRQWDFSAGTRRQLSPTPRLGPDLDLAIRDALAVYYFPGMWDWDPAIVLPLVDKGLDDALTRQRDEQGSGALSTADASVWEAAFEQAHALLDRYLDWAPGVDRFSPIRVATDFDALVADPADPDSGLVTADGAAIRYVGRIDLLTMDEHDRYWVVRHRVVDGPFPATDQLLLDEEQVAACWAWARFYDGMELAGTIYNELSTSAHLAGSPPGTATGHEPGSGGRWGSSTRRIYAKGRDEDDDERVRQTLGDGFRRTVVRRSRVEVSQAGRSIADEAIDMVREGLHTYPNPVAEHCAECAFVLPCLALTEGRDVESLLMRDYHRRPVAGPEIGRLGGSPHGVGRGWVPPPGSDR